MKKTIEYKGYTFTYHTDGHCVLVFKGINLTDEQLNGLPLKCIAGDVFYTDGHSVLVFKGINLTDGKLDNNVVEKTKAFIDTL